MKKYNNVEELIVIVKYELSKGVDKLPLNMQYNTNITLNDVLTFEEGLLEPVSTLKAERAEFQIKAICEISGIHGVTRVSNDYALELYCSEMFKLLKYLDKEGYINDKFEIHLPSNYLDDKASEYKLFKNLELIDVTKDFNFNGLEYNSFHELPQCFTDIVKLHENWIKTVIAS